MENLAPSLLGQEDSNDQYQQAAEENYAGRNSLQAKEPIHTDSLRLVLQSGLSTQNPAKRVSERNGGVMGVSANLRELGLRCLQNDRRHGCGPCVPQTPPRVC